MLTSDEACRKLGLSPPRTSPGRYYTTCPWCSHLRKGAHKRLKCLGITIDGTGVGFACMHCGEKGGQYYDSGRPDAPAIHRSAAAQEPRRTYADMQKGLKGRWQ